MRRTALALLALLVLTGCAPTAREPDRLALVRVLGVDGGGPVALAGVCGGEGEDAPRGAAEGESFSVALDRLPWSGQRELAVTSVTWLIAGPDTDLEALLLDLLREPELGAAITVWLAPDGAAAVLERCGDPVSDLELLVDEGIAAPTAAQAAAALAEGEGIRLPCVAEENGQLVPRGEALWQRTD